jgi:maltose alpha-D-glucosyltransferase / alpha-amylase
MSTSSSPEKSFLAALQNNLPSVLPQFLLQQRWFGGKARQIQSIEIPDIVPTAAANAYLIFARVNYATGPVETYAVPLVRISSEGEASSLRIHPEEFSEAIILKDALTDQQFLTHLFDAITNRMSWSGIRGQVRAISTSALQSLWQPVQGPLPPSLMKAEQSNTSIIYGKRLMLKIFRRLEPGLNPDLEIGAFLLEKSSFRNVPPLAGYVEYLDEKGAGSSLGILQGYVANRGDAWQFTLQALAEYYGGAPRSGGLGAGEIPHAPLLALCGQPVPEEARRRIGPYLDSAALLGRRTAELHLALAGDRENADFAPQASSESDHRAFAESAAQLLTANFALLRRLKDGMPDQTRQEAGKILQLEEIARRRFELLTQLKSAAMLTRIHGDYHLGQVLFTGSDFIIIDFEGEPARSLTERRQKRSPLQDVAGMLRSFHYAAYAPLLQQSSNERPRGEDLQALGSWAQYWQKWVSATFLKTYLEVSGDAIFIPKGREELALLLDVHLLDKAVYELGYELNNRPLWVRIPLDGISQLLRDSS